MIFRLKIKIVIHPFSSQTFWRFTLFRVSFWIINRQG